MTRLRVRRSESFHYFLIHFKGKPLFSGLWWFLCFFIYYALLLCAAGPFQVLAAIPWPWAKSHALSVRFGDDSYHLSVHHMALVCLGLQYLVFFVAFVIDRAAVRLLTVKDTVHPLRNLAHLISAPLVLLGYSAVSFWAIVTFVFSGKKMARHDMAAKEGESPARLVLHCVAPGSERVAATALSWCGVA